MVTEVVADEDIRAGMIVYVTTDARGNGHVGPLPQIEPGKMPVGAAARDIKAGEMVWYDPLGHTPDIRAGGA